jgi:branched-chain amino acid transport system substrate-binding protein
VNRRPRATRAVLIAVLLAAGTAFGGDGGAPQSPPYRRGGQEPLDFRGPDRDRPEPEVAEVVLAWFGPGDPGDADFGTLWQGAVLALDEENAAGGYRRRSSSSAAAPAAPGVPFRLVPAWSASPWQAGIADLLRLVYDRQAWAVIGGMDGTSTHLAAQVALKSRVPLLSPWSTDRTADDANVPWLYSLPPSDEAVAVAVAGELAGTAAVPRRGFAILASTDHASHATLRAVRRELSRRRLGAAAVVEFAPSELDPAAVAAHVTRGGSDAVLVLATALQTGRLVTALRAAGFSGTVVGGVAASGLAFRAAAAEAAEGVLAPRLVEPGARWDAFAAAFEARWGAVPDAPAAHGYDAVKVVVAAIRGAGLNRARIRDAVRALAPWSGASGPVRWNALGRNERRVEMGRWTAGRLGPRGGATTF